jgi:hypothetical protein
MSNAAGTSTSASRRASMAHAAATPKPSHGPSATAARRARFHAHQAVVTANRASAPSIPQRRPAAVQGQAAGSSAATIAAGRPAVGSTSRAMRKDTAARSRISIAAVATSGPHSPWSTRTIGTSTSIQSGW